MRAQQEYGYVQAWKRVLLRNSTTETLMGDFQSPELEEHRFLLFKLLNLYYFISEARKWLIIKSHSRCHLNQY